MSNTGNSVKFDAIREIDAGSITGNYQTLGAVFTRDCFLVWSTNNTNGDIYLSTDGVTDMKKYPNQSGRANDYKTNDMYVKKGTQFYIKYASVPAIPAGWFGLEGEWA